jgi:AmmeMemoRadiSam system protein A
MPVDPAARIALLDLARESVRRRLGGESPPIPEGVLQDMAEPRSAFVTLRARGSGTLRGCRGEVPARRPLPECVSRVAVSAALDDPRFTPVTLEELPGLVFEISALEPMREARPEDVRVGVHGLLLSSPRGTGLLLPQVPIEQGWDRSEFLEGACSKAGLPLSSWLDPDVTLSVFEAEVWSEE